MTISPSWTTFIAASASSRMLIHPEFEYQFMVAKHCIR